MKSSQRILLVAMVISLIALPILMVDGFSESEAECVNQKGDDCDCHGGKCLDDGCANSCAVTTKSLTCFCSDIPE